MSRERLKANKNTLLPVKPKRAFNCDPRDLTEAAHNVNRINQKSTWKADNVDYR